jgi:hypothetical protein
MRCTSKRYLFMLDWLERNPQDRFEVQPHSLDGTGVTRADLKAVYAEYVAAFDIELERV